MNSPFFAVLPSRGSASYRFRRKIRSAVWMGFCLWLSVLMLSLSASAQETSDACAAEPTDMSITYGDLVDCSLESIVDSDIYRWSGTQGELVLFRVRALTGSVEPCFTIFDATNTPIETSSCTNNQFLQEIQFELPATGTYTVLIADGGSNEAGKYRLLLERITPFSPTVEPIADFGLVIRRSVDLLVDVDFFSFESAADETMNIQARALSGSVEPCLTLYDPTDAIVATSSCSNNEFLQEVNNFMPATVGTYLLRIEDGGANEAGSYDITVQCVFGTCSALGGQTIFVDDFE